MIISPVTVVPGLDCRRCETDRGPFVTVNVGWTTKGSRPSDLADLVNGVPSISTSRSCNSRVRCRPLVASTSTSNRRMNSKSFSVSAWSARRSRCRPYRNLPSFDFLAEEPEPIGLRGVAKAGSTSTVSHISISSTLDVQLSAVVELELVERSVSSELGRASTVAANLTRLSAVRVDSST
jgi:hypothetical protein